MKSIILFLCIASVAALSIDSRTCAVCSTCKAGTYRTSICTATTDTQCAVCPSNFFCDNNLKTACPGITISASNSSTYLDCRCPDGTKGFVTDALTANCDTCPVGQFCVGSKVQCTC